MFIKHMLGYVQLTIIIFLSFFCVIGQSQTDHKMPSRDMTLKNSKASHESIGRLEYKLFGYRYNRHIDSTVKLRPINNQRGIASVPSSTSIKKGSRVITGDYTIKLKPKFKN